MVDFDSLITLLSVEAEQKATETAHIFGRNRWNNEKAYPHQKKTVRVGWQMFMTILMSHVLKYAGSFKVLIFS